MQKYLSSSQLGRKTVKNIKLRNLNALKKFMASPFWNFPNRYVHTHSEASTQSKFGAFFTKHNLDI